MPVFHTKIIESILEPVAQQVSRLVILHEEAEDGNAMPDLNRPVQAVSMAVTNLVKVGHETIESADDVLLKQDMPAALRRVESAATHLQQASEMLRGDPYSGPARKRLIEGSRGILQGTSGLLLCFDESEVRKIVRECKRVLEYLSVAEVIDSMEDLVQFLRDMSPALSMVAREVAARASELTHRPHALALERCLDSVKQLAPVLITSIKAYIHLLSEGGKGIEDAAENRNYLAQRMADEIHEIIRVLQLTSYVEDGGEKDNVSVLRALQSNMQSKLDAAHAFLNDANALRNSSGERALRSVLTSAQRAAEHLNPDVAHTVRTTVSRMSRMMESHSYTSSGGEQSQSSARSFESYESRSAGMNGDQLCDERQYGRGRDVKAINLASDLRQGLQHVDLLINEGLKDAERHGGKSVQDRMETAYKWLLNPACDPQTRTEGQNAINSIVAQGQRIADGLQGREKSEILQLCSDVQRLSDKLAGLCAAGKGDSDEARAVARQLTDKLQELKKAMDRAVVNRVVEDFIDCATPLRLFTEAVNQPEGAPHRDANFQSAASNLKASGNRAANTGLLLAHTLAHNKRLADQLTNSAKQVESLCPQVISAGKIRFNNPQSKVAEENFNNLKNQYSEALLKTRDLCDQAVDPLDFVRTAGELMRKHTYLCEEAIRNNDPQKIVDNTSAIARLANRVMLVTAAERDNTEDAQFARALSAAHARLAAAVPPAVRAAKAVAQGERGSAPLWTTNNNEILQATKDVEAALSQHYAPPPPPPPLPEAFSQMHLQAPTRPPPPGPPARPPLPADTDDEGEDIFAKHPHPSQPILVAAHNLHKAVREWSSKDNEIIAAAKRMAILMARLSELVRSDSKGSKRELIATAKAIAEASEEVTRLAKKLALECTDKRIRTNLLQVCERIPTIGTQLKILSTVKATMLGAQVGMADYRGSEEDQEATEMLVGNAQNLMQSVKETVKAAEGASIKIRSEQGGYKLRWVRRSPWYQI